MHSREDVLSQQLYCVRCVATLNLRDLQHGSVLTKHCKTIQQALCIQLLLAG